MEGVAGEPWPPAILTYSPRQPSLQPKNRCSPACSQCRRWKGLEVWISAQKTSACLPARVATCQSLSTGQELLDQELLHGGPRAGAGPVSPSCHSAGHIHVGL